MDDRNPSPCPSYELVKDEISASVKRDYHGSESVRYSNGNNGSRSNSRECNHVREFSRTPPKKQIQKKSALLRIQTVKPNHRNRDVEQLRYVPDSNNNFFRGNKDQHGERYSKTEERKRSPVELDISFESNSLVAKAIVAAPSTSGAAPVSAKLSSGGENLNDNDDNYTNSKKNVGDACSEPGNSGTSNPHEKNKVVISVEASGTCKAKLASKVVKKKKVVKKVVKKVSVNTNSSVSASPLLANAVGGTVQEDCVTVRSSNTASGIVETVTCLEEKSNAVDKVSVPDDQGNVLTEDKKGGLSLLSSGLGCRLHESKNDEDSDTGEESRSERRGSISNSPPYASSSVDKNSGSDCLDVCNSIHDLVRVTNIDKGTKSLNGSTFEINDMDCGNEQFCQSEVFLSPRKYTNEGCSENRNHVDVGNEMNYNVISADIVNTHNSVDESVDGFNSNDLTSSEEKVTGDDSRNSDIDGKAYCKKMAPAITRFSSSEENSDTAIPLPSSGMVAFSSLEDTRIQDGQDCLQHTSGLKQGSDDGSSCLEDSIIVHHFGILKDAEKLVSPGEVPISTENCDIDKTFPNSNISLGFDIRVTNRIEKRDVRTRLEFLSLNLDDISLNSVSHSNDADRGSSIVLKDPYPSEVFYHSIQSLDFDSQSSQVGDIALHGKRAFSEVEFCVANDDRDDANKVSPVSKRKKVNASHPNLSQFQSECSDSIVAITSNAEVPISFSDNQEHKKDDIALLSIGMGIQSNAQSMPHSGDIDKLSDCIFKKGSFESMDANKETKSSEHLELQHSDTVSTHCEDLAIPNVQFSELGYERSDNVTPVVSISNSQTDILVIGNIKGEKTDTPAAENNSHHRDEDDVQRSPRDDMLSNDLNMKDNSLAQENLLFCPADGDGVTISNSNNELIEDLPDAVSDMFSQEMASDLPDKMITEFTSIYDENICGDEENLSSVSMVKHGSDSNTSSIQHTEKTIADHAIGCNDPITRNIMSAPTQIYSKVTPQGLNSNGSKNQSGSVILKPSQGHSFTFPKSKTKPLASSVHVSKSRTWHRTDNNNNPPTSLPRVNLSAGILPPKRPILERKKNFQNTSYIRKGNSLVRNPTPVSAIPQISSTSLGSRPTPVSSIPKISSTNPLPLSFGEMLKGTKPENRVDLTDQPINCKTELSNTPLQRHRLPSLPMDTKLGENISSPLSEPLSSGCCENASDLRKFTENNDAPASCEDVLKQYETPENQTGPSSNGESQAEGNDGNVSSLNSKKIVYIKPKTNQLVATSSSCDIIASIDDKGQTACSDSYYKRRKNQLVRTTFENHVNQTVAMPNNIVNHDGQGARKVLCNRKFTKRRSNKGMYKKLIILLSLSLQLILIQI